MIRSSSLVLALAALAAGMAGCAGVDEKALGGGDLGESKQEFEASAQGGLYRFQYVTEGTDGYRVVLWRQGDSLSDDAKDANLVANVVRSVFGQRFCKELNLPATLAEGSPAPVGEIGKWTASLRCVAPPPPAKKAPAEKPAKKKPASGGETVSETKPKSSGDAKPAASSSYDGPMTCTATANGFDCKPKR